MAEKENCPEIFSSIQDNPDGSVSMSEQPTANSIDGSVSISEQPTANSIIVQALVTNQSALAAISEAILSANKPSTYRARCSRKHESSGRRAVDK